MTESTGVQAPWLDHLDGIPATLDYYQGSMFCAVERAAREHPRKIAFDFMGRSTTYRDMIENINQCARSLVHLGVKEGDRVTIALPNCPQAIYSFYAINMIGAVANMVHPLASENEMKFFLNESESVVAIVLDQCYSKFEAIRAQTKVKHIIIASVKDELAPEIQGRYDADHRRQNDLQSQAGFECFHRCRNVFESAEIRGCQCHTEGYHQRNAIC